MTPWKRSKALSLYGASRPPGASPHSHPLKFGHLSKRSFGGITNCLESSQRLSSRYAKDLGFATKTANFGISALFALRVRVVLPLLSCLETEVPLYISTESPQTGMLDVSAHRCVNCPP